MATHRPRTQAPLKMDITQAMQKWLDNLTKRNGWKSPMALGWIEQHTVNMLDHHRAKGNLMADWNAAWRTWMRNVVTDFGRKVAPQPISKTERVKRTLKEIEDEET